MSLATITWSRPKARDGVGYVNEGSDRPRMRPRTGKRGTDRQLAKLLNEALDNLARSNCSFWACEGPNRQRDMMTCVKCAGMRRIGTVLASLEARK